MRRQLGNRDAHFCSPKSSRRTPRAYRRALFEPLEPRLALTAPTLAAISDITMTAGIPMYIALNGYDADGDTLSFSASSTNSSLTGTVPTGNRSMRITVAGYGDMVFELFEDGAPNTTARIISLAQSGFYNGIKFHRILEDFVIQGGDPTGTGSGGSTLGDIDDEFNADLRHSCAGILSMAKSTDDTNDSQFFITNAATPTLDFQHSVFGFLTEGDSVREAISQVDVTSNGSETSKPVTDVVMSSVSIFTDPDSGVLVLKAAAGFTGTANVTVTVNDGNGGTAQRTFQVTVNAASSSYDGAPYMAAIQPIHMKAGGQYNFNIPGLDADGDAIYYSSTITSTTSGLQTSTTSTTGQTTLTASSTAAGVYTLRLRAAASENYLTLSDSYSYYHDTQLVPVYVAPAAPTLDLLASTDSGASDSDNITNHDNTTGKTLRFRVSGLTNGAVVNLYVDGSTTPIAQGTASGTELILETNGALDLADGTHTFTATQELEGQSVSVGNYNDTVDLVSDASSGLAVTVDTTSPQFTSNPLTLAPQGAVYGYNAETNEEAGGNVRYSLVQAADGMSINELTGRITWTPTAAQIGTQNVTIWATDLAGYTTEQTFQVTVCTAATIEAISNKTVQEGQALGFTVVATDTNLPLSYALENAPSGATIDASSGEFTWTPTESQGPAQHTITVAVTNSQGAVSRASFTVTVTEVNAAPQLDTIDNATIAEGQAFAYQAVASDADLPANTLIFSLGNGAPAGVSINAQTGAISWTPSEAQGGEDYSITVVVSDGAGGTASQTFTVTVTEVDSAPVFTPISEQSVAVGQEVRLTLQAQDPDQPESHAVVYSLEADAPAGVVLNSETGELTWTVPESYSGEAVTLVVRATEVVGEGETGLSSTQLVHLQVATKSPLEELLDRTWLSLARRVENWTSPLQRAGVAQELQLPQIVPTMTVPSFLSGNFQVEGLFGPRITVQGGGGSLRPQTPKRDRIDMLNEPIDEDSERGSEKRIDDVSASEQEQPSWQQMSDAVDEVLEFLAGDPASTTADADSADAAPAEQPDVA